MLKKDYYPPHTADIMILYGGSDQSSDENIGNVYKSVLYQRGYGLDHKIYYHQTYGLGFADTLQGLIRLVAPVFKSGLRYLGSQAVNTAANIAQDVISGSNVKEAAKTHVTNTAGEIFAKAPEALVDVIKTVKGKRPALSVPETAEGVTPSFKKRRVAGRYKKRKLSSSYPALEKISRR